MMITDRSAAALDVSAVTLSTLCVIHCLALPVLTAMLPLGVTWLENEWVHRAFVLLAVPVSGSAIYTSLVNREGSAFPLAATIGLLLLGAAAFVEALHDWETVLTSAGALILAFAHVGRWVGRHRHARAQADRRC